MSPSLAFVPHVDDELAEAIESRLDLVEQRLHDVVRTNDSLATWTARHLMDAGGKRVRPLLVLLTAALGDLDRPEVIDTAVLVELTHLATLYHDDVMDDASTRRGARTAHELWGNSVAILTGDFLFARASALSADLGPEAVKIHARTFERLCLGQLHETVGVQDGQDPFAHYLGILADKTASLIASSGELAALQSGAPAGVPDIMRRYGERVGVAFQLADDVLDLRSDRSASGKTPGTDLREGVPTMPTLLLRARSAAGDSSAGTRAVIEALDADLSDDESLERAVALLREDPAVDQTATMAADTAEEAIAVLHELPESPVREALEAFTTSLVLRNR